MSRRKQLNPKPLLKGDCENSIGEMEILRGPDEEYLNSVKSDNTDEITTSSELQQNQSPNSTDPISQSNSNCSSPPSSANENHDVNMIDDQQKSPSTPPRPSSAAPKPQKPKSEHDISDHLPKLRLNAILASDPALQPEAKDIKNIRVANDNKSIEDCDRNMDDSQSDETMIGENIKMEPTYLQRVTDAPPPPSLDVVRVPGFMCGPCGIKFSSLSTLEAHQTYYCTHRKEADAPSPSSKVSTTEDGIGTDPSTKCVRTGKQYACSQCSYSADKKVSLNRHMRMHQASPTPSSVTSNGDDSSSQIQQIDRYCTDCDIRFSSTKTYRAHKQHYCSSRHRDGSLPSATITTATTKSNSPKGGSGSTTPPEGAKSPQIIAPPQPYLALPTNPIVIIPYSLIRGASVLPGPLTSVSPGITNPDSTCFLLKNGSLQPIAQALAVQPTTGATTISADSVIINQNSPIVNSIPAAIPSTPAINVRLNCAGYGKSTDLIKPVKKKDNPIRESPIPLDLSVRRLSTEIILPRDRTSSFSSSVSGENPRVNIEMMMEGKENLSIDSNSVTPEQIVCAPSLPGSPPLTPSPKRSSHSPRGILAASPNLLSPSQQSVMLRPLMQQADLAARLAEPSLVASQSQHLERQNVELALRLSTSSVVSANDNSAPTHPPNVININKKPGSSNSHHSLGQPQIFVKQGVSKCKECNIVFCRYENYLAHKKHYCSARNLDDKDGAKPSPPPSPLPTNSSGGGGGTSHAYQQLICAACGIKFTSLDNLSAHQTYYCPKRIEIPIQSQVQAQKEKCPKCKSIHDAGQPCPLISNPYKCPICDVVSSNAAESRRHIETHAGVKAFRCSICRYKGNTLRGMRTHIRMHFDKKSNDFNEEHYISCILEEDGLEIPPAAQLSQESVSSTQLHCCDKCNYSSSYKGNVVRHIKLVHSQSQSSSTSPSLGEGGESLIHNDDLNKQHPATSYSVTIKTEPTDDQPKSQDSVREPPLKMIKLEAKDPTEDRLVDTSIISSNSGVSSDNIGIISQMDASNAIASTPAPIASIASAGIGPGPKYCNVCDIKFNYLNTFIAHKKFYCKNAKSEMVDSPVVVANATKSPVMTSARGTETPVL